MPVQDTLWSAPSMLARTMLACVNGLDVAANWQMMKALAAPSLRIPEARGRTWVEVVGTLSWHAGPPGLP